jgi:hypothetical protein
MRKFFIFLCFQVIRFDMNLRRMASGAECGSYSEALTRQPQRDTVHFFGEAAACDRDWKLKRVMTVSSARETDLESRKPREL